MSETRVYEAWETMASKPRTLAQPDRTRVTLGFSAHYGKDQIRGRQTTTRRPARGREHTEATLKKGGKVIQTTKAVVRRWQVRTIRC
jgi:hypothetical protein